LYNFNLSSNIENNFIKYNNNINKEINGIHYIICLAQLYNKSLPSSYFPNSLWLNIISYLPLCKKSMNKNNRIIMLCNCQHTNKVCKKKNCGNICRNCQHCVVNINKTTKYDIDYLTLKQYDYNMHNERELYRINTDDIDDQSFRLQGISGLRLKRD
jgi:hypothetical protein